MSLKQELCWRHYSLPNRLRLCNSVVTSTILYDCGSWTMTLNRERRLRTVQRQMLRKVWGFTGRKKGVHDYNPTSDQTASTLSTPSSSLSSSEASLSSENSFEGARATEYEEGWVEWQKRTARCIDAAMASGKIINWVREQRRRKWTWAGHILRRTDGRWTTRMVNWIPHGGERGPGRPPTRWEDSLDSFAKSRGFKWQDVAREHRAWYIWKSDLVGDHGNGKD